MVAISDYHKKADTTKNIPISVPPIMFIWKIFGYSSFNLRDVKLFADIIVSG